MGAKAWAELGRYSAVGIELVLTILILAGAGRWVDAHHPVTHGWGVTIGFVLGVAVAFRNLAAVARRMQRDIERAERDDPMAGRWKVDEGWLHEGGGEDTGSTEEKPHEPDGDGRGDDDPNAPHAR